MPLCSKSVENALIGIVVVLILLNIVLFLIIALLYNYIKVTRRNLTTKDKPKALVQRIPVVSRCSVFRETTSSDDLYYDDDKADGKTQSPAINNDDVEPVVNTWTPPVKDASLERTKDGRPKPQKRTYQDEVDSRAQQQAVKNSYQDEPVRKPKVAPKTSTLNKQGLSDNKNNGSKQIQKTTSEKQQAKYSDYDKPVSWKVSKTESESEQLTYEDVTDEIGHENDGIDEAIYDNEESSSPRSRTLPHSTGQTPNTYVLGDQNEGEYIDSIRSKPNITEAKTDTYEPHRGRKDDYLNKGDNIGKYQNMQQQKKKTDSEYANQRDSDSDYVNVGSIKKPVIEADKKQYINVNRTSGNASSSQEVYLDLDTANGVTQEVYLDLEGDNTATPQEQEVYVNLEEDQGEYTNLQDQDIYETTD